MQQTASGGGSGDPLKGKTALVTGASSGIGRAVAVALAQCGLDVHLVGRRQDALRAVAEEAGGAFVIAADLATEEGRRAVVRAVPSPLHVLVHSAGAYFRGPVAEIDAQAWAALDAVNLHAPLLLTAACLPALKEGEGHVVFINSTAGIQSGPRRLRLFGGKARPAGRGRRIAPGGQPRRNPRPERIPRPHRHADAGGSSGAGGPRSPAREAA